MLLAISMAIKYPGKFHAGSGKYLSLFFFFLNCNNHHNFECRSLLDAGKRYKLNASKLRIFSASLNHVKSLKALALSLYFSFFLYLLISSLSLFLSFLFLFFPSISFKKVLFADNVITSSLLPLFLVWNLSLFHWNQKAPLIYIFFCFFS